MFADRLHAAITPFRRVEMNNQRSMGNVDHPELNDILRSIHSHFIAEVVSQRGVGDFNQQSSIGCSWSQTGNRAPSKTTANAAAPRKATAKATDRLKPTS